MNEGIYKTLRHNLKNTLVRLGLYEESPFMRFEKNVNKETWQKHDEILRWADALAAFESSEARQEWTYNAADTIVQKGFLLRKNCLNQFANKFKGNSSLRVLIHVPSAIDSPAGASLFINLAEALNYIGIVTSILPWRHDNIDEILNRTRPTVFITSDHESYLNKIDWSALARYRSNNVLKVGLTASLAEYGNSSLENRLSWASKNKIDFYYSFRSRGYLKEREEYRPFQDHGYHIHSIEFGANVQHYYPVPNVIRDIDYVFLGSSNRDKMNRYMAYFGNILNQRVGFIDGPGWHNIKRFSLNNKRDKYIYARAKVGLNLHLEEQIKWANELNERTYMLAACGVPQLIDHPKLLSQRFRLAGMFVADNEEEYKELFEYILNNPDEAEKRAFIAMEDVYGKHTTFHRAEEFTNALLCELIK